MRLFDFFKTKADAQTAHDVAHFSPALEVDRQAETIYRNAFFDVMAGVDGLRKDDLAEICKIIIEGAGGYSNLERYCKPVFQKFFSGRPWSSQEYDLWDEEFRRFGSYPARWMPDLSLAANGPVLIEKTYHDFSAPELKDLLKSRKIGVPATARKAELTALVRAIPDLQKTDAWKAKESAVRDRAGYKLFTLLVQYMSFRATLMLNVEKSERAGVEKHELIYVDEGDKTYVALALNRNAKALPPFFPSDITQLLPAFQ